MYIHYIILLPLVLWFSMLKVPPHSIVCGVYYSFRFQLYRICYNTCTVVCPPSVQASWSGWLASGMNRGWDSSPETPCRMPPGTHTRAECHQVHTHVQNATRYTHTRAECTRYTHTRAERHQVHTHVQNATRYTHTCRMPPGTHTCRMPPGTHTHVQNATRYTHTHVQNATRYTHTCRMPPGTHTRAYCMYVCTCSCSISVCQ